MTFSASSASPREIVHALHVSRYHAAVVKHQLLNALDQAYQRQSWHGTNLRGSLRGLTPAEASRRPRPGRHNIWELAVHCAYWKYAVWRRLTGASRGSFPLEGSNFFVRPDGPATAAAWRADLKLLESMHRQLRAAVAGLTPRDLPGVPGAAGSRTPTWCPG